MSTRQEFQEELRKRQVITRIEHERTRTRHENELKNEAGRISTEQERLRKQHERLENAKRLNKETSYVPRDRRHSLPCGDDKLPLLVPKKQHSKSTHTPDYSNVKSRLYDYERATPRSRLQLMQGVEGTSPLPTKESPAPPKIIAPMSSHAFEANKASYTDIVKNLARIPHGHKTSSTSIDKESERKSASRPTHGDAKAVTFKDESDTMDAPSHSRARRGSLQSSTGDTFAPPLQRRRASLPASDTDGPLLPQRSRRMSLPSSRSILPTIQVDARDSTEDIEDNESRLAELYNKAIETVQLADETILTLDRPNQQRLRHRRHSDGGAAAAVSSGFDYATLKELEAILSDARNYSNRKGMKEDHLTRLDVGTNRAQKKRIEHLEQVLKKLNPNFDQKIEMDPAKILQCAYLRLSQSNIEALEGMLRQQGKDPGIHIHMDVSNLDIWSGLKEERTDLQPPSKPSSPKKRQPKQKRSLQAQH